MLSTTQSLGAEELLKLKTVREFATSERTLLGQVKQTVSSSSGYIIPGLTKKFASRKKFSSQHWWMTLVKVAEVCDPIILTPANVTNAGFPSFPGLIF